MKKLVLLTLIGLIVLGIAGCDKKEEKYAKEKQTLSSLIQATNRFTRELEVTRNRIAIGRTIVNYISEIKRMKPDMYELEKICPDYLTSVGYKNAPQELQPLFKRFAESLSLMKAVVDGKMARFGGDKDVIKIFQELKEILYYY